MKKTYVIVKPWRYYTIMSLVVGSGVLALFYGAIFLTIFIISLVGGR